MAQSSNAMLENHRKYKKVEGNIKNADVVIVYGDVKGNIVAAKDVIVINGDVKGNLVNCENVAGLLANRSISKDALWEKAGGYSSISREDLGLHLHPPITLRE